VQRHFSLLSLEALPEHEFATKFSGKGLVDSEVGKDGFIFVHGFNTSFETSVFSTAQLAWDLQFRGAAFAYSWPSSGSTLNYFADRESVQATRGHFQEFVKIASKRAADGRLHIIAQGLGAQLVMEALASMPDGMTTRIGQVVLAAPDIDPDLFNALCSRVKELATRVTVYASANDKALDAMSKLAGGSRAGSITPEGPTIRSACADVIDATAARSSNLAHQYVGGTRGVLLDLAQLLSGDLSNPSVRSIRRIDRPDGSYWQLD
jgi:esterase/lipase superfamily enzyme